jgi:hypothetical protein
MAQQKHPGLQVNGMQHQRLVVEDADIRLSILCKIGARAGFNSTRVIFRSQWTEKYLME